MKLCARQVNRIAYVTHIMHMSLSFLRVALCSTHTNMLTLMWTLSPDLLHFVVAEVERHVSYESRKQHWKHAAHVNVNLLKQTHKIKNNKSSKMFRATTKLKPNKAEKFIRIHYRRMRPAYQNVQSFLQTLRLVCHWLDQFRSTMNSDSVCIALWMSLLSTNGRAYYISSYLIFLHWHAAILWQSHRERNNEKAPDLAHIPMTSLHRK